MAPATCLWSNIFVGENFSGLRVLRMLVTSWRSGEQSHTHLLGQNIVHKSYAYKKVYLKIPAPQLEVD